MKTKITVFIYLFLAGYLFAQDPFTLSGDGKTLTKWTGTGTTADMTVYPALQDVTTIASTAFNGNTTLTNIVISRNVSVVDQYTFAWMESIRSVTVETGNSFYSDIDGVLFNWGKTFLFFYPRAKTGETYVVPETVEELGGLAFFRCTNLKYLYFPASLNRIVLNETFFGSTVLQKVNIPNLVEVLPVSSFSDCYQLQDVTISNQLQTIGAKAFDQCQSLPSIELPATLTSVGDMAFYNALALTSITLHATTPPTLGNNVFNVSPGSTLPTRTLYVPLGRKQAYQSAWGGNFIGEIIEMIPNSVNYHSELTNINVHVSGNKIVVSGLPDFPNIKLNLYAVSGHLIKSATLNEVVGTQNLKGVYLLEIVTNEKKIKTLKIVF